MVRDKQEALSVARTPEEMVAEWRSERDTLRADIAELQSGTRRHQESSGGATWTDTTQDWIARMTRTADLFERLIKAYESENADRT